jgi:hypothetical protein
VEQWPQITCSDDIEENRKRETIQRYRTGETWMEMEMEVGR